jgi:hypothetical protein
MVESQLVDSDYVQVSRQLLRRHLVRLQGFWIMLAIIVLSVLIDCLTSAARSISILATVVSAAAFVWPIVRGLSLRPQRNWSSFPELASPMRREFSEEGVMLQSFSVTTTMTWQAVAEVFETRDFYFLKERTPLPGAKVIARKGLASTHDEAFFRLLVAEHAKTDFKEHGAAPR